MMAAKTDEHEPEKLENAETVCSTLAYFAHQFGYSDPTNFRRSVLDRNLFPYRRITDKRWIMRRCDLPTVI